MNAFDAHNKHLAVHALLLTLLPLLPIPLLDLLLESYVARRMFTPLMLDQSQTRHFIGRGGNFCLGCIWSIITYPVMKLIKLIKVIVRFQSYVQTFYYWYYKGYLVIQAHDGLSTEQLSNHQIMRELGTDMDQWLRSPECKKMFSKSAAATFNNIAQMIRMLNMWKEHQDSSPLTHLMQHQEMLDTWITEWCTPDDSPE